MANRATRVKFQPFDPGPAAWRDLLGHDLLGQGQSYAPLEQNLTADVVVIGAGFAGLTAAHRLKQLMPNAEIAVLEARGVAEGPAGRNSGFMIDLPHKLSSKDYAGELDQDRRETVMNRHAIEYARSIVDEFNMSQEAFSVTGKINAAATPKGTQHNLDYAEHLSWLGESHELLDSNDMKAICGSNYYQSGLFTPGTAMLQPALYIRNLAAGVAGQGVKIFENSAVVAMEKSGADWQLHTAKGRITAPKVVLAVNGHAESFGKFTNRLMHIYLYASMTRALTADEARALGGQERWGFTPADPMGTTVRRFQGTGGDRIIVRNRFTWAPKRYVSPAAIKSIARVHDRSFNARFPQLKGVEMEYRWGGLLCLSRNTVPAFGALDDGLFSACCQNGLGTAMGTLSGKLVAEQIAGHSSQLLDQMLAMAEPTRLPPEPFLSLGANAVLRWGEFKASREL